MTAKIRIKVGNVEVDYEGPKDFLDEKLYELVDKLSTLAEKVPTEQDDADVTDTENQTLEPLASFLRRTDAGQTHIRRFLATAEWLHQKGKSRLTTSDVTTALKQNNQSKVTNASQCLNRNVASGFCEKDGAGFFVTEDGKSALR